MSIFITCPNGHSLKIKDKYAGQRRRCPACKAVIDIPTSDDVEDAIMDILKPQESGLGLDMKVDELPTSLWDQQLNQETRICAKCYKEIPKESTVCLHCYAYVEEEVEVDKPVQSAVDTTINEADESIMDILQPQESGLSGLDLDCSGISTSPWEPQQENDETRLCAKCYKDVPKEVTVCPHCYAYIEALID